MTITAALTLRNHSKNTRIDSKLRISSINYKFGDKTQLWSLSSMLTAVVVNFSDFYVNCGALSEEEALSEFRMLIKRLEQIADGFEKELNNG